MEDESLDLRLHAYRPELHYSTAAEWWQRHKWPIIPEGILPPLGYMIYRGDTPVVIGWLYRTDTPIAIMEWVVANPDVTGPVRRDALHMLVESCIQTANELGHRVVMSWAVNESLIKKYEAHGFTKGDEGMTSMVYNIP